MFHSWFSCLDDSVKLPSFSFVRKIGMFPKKVSKNMEATSVQKKAVLMNNISLANGITTVLRTHLDEQVADSS